MHNNYTFIYEEIENDEYKYVDFFNYHDFKFNTVQKNHITQFQSYSVNQFPIYIVYSSEKEKIIEAFQPEPNNSVALNAFINRVQNLIN